MGWIAPLENLLSRTGAAALVALAPFLFSQGMLAQERHPDWPEAISDNSFLVEEAYNQDPGVVQWIGTFTRTTPGNAWVANLTNEWPVPDETNQLSFSVQYASLGTRQPQGWGDTFLNYRFQALREDRDGVAFAPRLSIIFPTGDWRNGEGAGSVGWQVGLPFSKRVTRSLALHFNVGATYLPGARILAAGGRETHQALWSTSQGASLVWLISPRFNLLVEGVAYQIQAISAEGGTSKLNQAFLNPGFRWAFNFSKGQLVLGASVPLGFTPDSTDSGILLYLSWEARVWKVKQS